MNGKIQKKYKMQKLYSQKSTTKSPERNLKYLRKYKKVVFFCGLSTVDCGLKIIQSQFHRPIY